MNKLKQAIQKRQVTFGTWMQIPHPASAEILACAGFDWICVDVEHAPIDGERLSDIFRAIENGGAVPVARVPLNDEIWIKRTLDSGAKGIIVPMVNNEKEAVKAAHFCRYPPVGKRSFGYCRANQYGANFEEYVSTEPDEIVVILQIEHEEAVKNLNHIHKHGKHDATFIGPYDLSGSFGQPGDFDCPKYKELLEDYEIISLQWNVPTGAHIIRPSKDNILQHINKGYKVIALGLDNVLMMEKAQEVLKIGRENCNAGS